MNAPTPDAFNKSASWVDADDNIAGTVFLGTDNAYANVSGVLLSIPLNASKHPDPLKGMGFSGD